MTEEIKQIRSLIEAEKLEEAEKAVKDGITKNPDSPGLLNLKGELMLKMNKLEEAKRIFSDIRRQYPNNSEALNNLAVCMIYGNDWERATNLLLEILKMDPSNAVAKENLNFIKNEVSEVSEKLVSEAKSLMEKGQIPGAEKLLSKVLNLNNKHVEASIYLAAIKMKDGRFEKAEKMLSTISEITSAQFKAFKKKEEEEDIIENNMFWIFGSGRSGSSWLAMQLLKHEETVCWNEPLIGSHLANIYWEIDKYSRFIDRDAQRAEYFFSSDFGEIWKHDLRKMIIHRVFAQYPEASKKKIIIKEPNGSFAADIIMQTLLNSKIIFLLRDGRDVLDSTIDAYRKDSWAKEFVKLPQLDEQARRKIIIEGSTAWRKQIEIVKMAFENHNTRKRLLLKYEELRYDTFNQVKRVYNFLEVSISDEELLNIVNRYSFENIPQEEKGKGKVFRKAKPGGWRESFSDIEIEIMNAIMGDKLRDYGYEV